MIKVIVMLFVVAFASPMFAYAAHPDGRFESADCNVLSGWACDPAYPNAGVTVLVSDSVMAYTSNTFTGGSRPDAAGICGGGTNYQWQWTMSTPLEYKNGWSHTLYAQGADIWGKVTTLMNVDGGYGKTISGCCPAPSTWDGFSCVAPPPSQ